MTDTRRITSHWAAPPLSSSSPPLVMPPPNQNIDRVMNPATTPRNPAMVITATSRWATWSSS